MLFNSYEFILLFLPIVFCIYFFFNRFNNISISLYLLSLASLCFYAWWNVYYLGLIIFSIIFNFYTAKYFLLKQNISQRIKQLYLVMGIIINLSFLIYFKYSNFIILNINKILFTDIDLFNIILPLAISFFTFQQIGFLVDCYYSKIKKVNFHTYSIFVLFFPQLIAGPIIRFSEVNKQYIDKFRKKIN